MQLINLMGVLCSWPEIVNIDEIGPVSFLFFFFLFCLVMFFLKFDLTFPFRMQMKFVNILFRFFSRK